MRRFKFKWVILLCAIIQACYSFLYKSPESGLPIAIFTILIAWFLLECYFDILDVKRKVTFRLSERIIIASSAVLMLLGITGGDVRYLSQYHLLIFSTLWVGLLILSALYLVHQVPVDPKVRVLKQFVEHMNQTSEFGLQRMHTIYQAMVLTAPSFPIDNLLLTIYADLISISTLADARDEVTSPKLEHFMRHHVDSELCESLLHHHDLEGHFEGIEEIISQTLSDVVHDGTFEVTGYSSIYMLAVFAYVFNEILILERNQLKDENYQVVRETYDEGKKTYHRLIHGKDAFEILQAFRQSQ